MQTRKAIPAVIIAALALAACAPQPHLMSTPLSDAAFQPWVGTGQASLSGQAFLKTVGGDVKTCAGEHVTLLPDNAYDEEWWNAAKAGQATDLPPDVGRYFRRTTCDAFGRFRFDGLPAGRWIVLTVVTWGVPSGNWIAPIDTEGGELTRAVDLRAGDNGIILGAADETD